MRSRPVLLILGFVLTVAIGYWVAGTAWVGKTDADRPARTEVTAEQRRMLDDPPPRFRSGDRPPGRLRDRDALAEGAIEGQRVLVFQDRDALERFLARMGDNVKLLGRLDALNALRVGFDDYADLAGLLDGDEMLSMIFPVITPPLPDGSVQPGALALGNGLLEWLGITGDNSDWGKGVRIAILDTGVDNHAAFQSLIRSINLVDLLGDPSALNGHGTAVASMIIGNGGMTPGVAPGADIISVRVADDLGMSDSFLLAQGIIAAVDAGARLINISMGSFGQSALVNNAIAYASEHGALIFAAAGNNGVNQIYQPAAHPGVIAVGAVDGRGNHLDFSNTGNQIAVSAPGYGLNAAWPGDQAAMVTGTSFSTPIVVGAVAAVMTEAGPGSLTPTQAWQLLSTYLNDAGAPGLDPQYGAGMPDIGRVLNAGTPGIHDAAVASQRVLPPDPGNPYGRVEVLIQNRGTEPLVNTAVQLRADGVQTTHNITMLAPNAVTTVSVPITRPLVGDSPPFEVDARVSVSPGIQDVKPSNDRRIEAHAPAAP